MTSTPEQAVAALVATIAARRDAVLPAALVIDGDPSMQDVDTPDAGQLGIFMSDRGMAAGLADGPQWRETDVQIECLVIGSDAATRRTRLRTLLDLVESALAADRSLGGAVTSCVWEPMDPRHLAVDGAADAQSETVLVTLEYYSNTQL
jgi:hypothetical protein